MKLKESIAHSGIVSRVGDGKVEVKIISHSACSSCDAKGACNISEIEEKIVEVPEVGNSYQPGDHVQVSITQSTGNIAVLLAYLVPFVFMFVSLLIVFSLTKSEGVAGISAIAAVLVYYLILILFKNKIKKSIVFSIHPIAEMI